MKQETINAVASMLNALAQQPPKHNPLSSQTPPGYPKVGPFARPRPQDTKQAAADICARINNILRNESEIEESVWIRNINIIKDSIRIWSDKCWRFCNDTEAVDIIKVVCEMEGITFPSKFND